MRDPNRRPLSIYVASSWRNARQPAIVAALRDAGHEVYDFRNPGDGREGFSWKQATSTRPPWSAEETRAVLSLPRSEGGFQTDLAAMVLADVIVMVQPCGRSAALELGWGAGSGRGTVVLLDDDQEPELMLKVADALVTSIDEMLVAVERVGHAAQARRAPAADANAPAVAQFEGGAR